MEEAVGKLWHRFISRAATHENALTRGSPLTQSRVLLAEMTRSIELMFRCAGGSGAVRVVPAGLSGHGGVRRWLQRMAWQEPLAPLPTLDAQTLALPPVLNVFRDAALNRDLYLWLAAQAAGLQTACEAHPHAWIDANAAATQLALQRFPGLRPRYERIVRALLAMRPVSLRPSSKSKDARAGMAEQQVQQALRASLNNAPMPTCDAQVSEVAPVWCWLVPAHATNTVANTRPDPAHAEGAHRESGTETPADKTRRNARNATDGSQRNALVMLFRAESLFSWADHVQVNRATDDDDDGNALNAANDMQQLAIAPDGAQCAARVKFDLDLPSASVDDLVLEPGIALPEWDFHRNALVEDRCHAQLLLSREARPYTPGVATRTTARRVRRRLEAMQASLRWQHGQPHGDQLDLDAWVRWQTHTFENTTEAPRVFMRQAKTQRSLATLLLADLSLSTDAWAGNNARVIDVIRDALYVFGESLAACGDAFDITGFSSVRRNVRMHRIKPFEETWGAPVLSRLGAIKPGYYTRLGAAIRYASKQLSTRGERQRLLLILTDGKPNDLDAYEGRYGLEDTRHAIHEARALGLTPFCVTIDATGHDYLAYLFGNRDFTVVQRPQDLVSRLTQIYSTLAQ